MAEIRPSQGREPYTGANILGAGIAGFRTPEGTGLSPEAEQMLKEAYLRQLAAIAKLEQELAIQSVTSYANIITSAQQAAAQAVSAVANLARTGQMNNQMVSQALLAINGVEQGIIDEFSPRYEAKSSAFIKQQGFSLEEQAVTAITNTINELRERGTPPDQVAAAIQQQMAKVSQDGYSNVVGPKLRELQSMGADVVTLVDTKKLARGAQLDALSNAYDIAIRGLDPGSDWDQKLRARLSDPSLKTGIVGQSALNGIRDREYRDFETTSAELDAAERIRIQGSDRKRALEKTILGMSVGIPKEIAQNFTRLASMSAELSAKGPEEFAKSLQEMPAPLSVQMTKQRLENQLEQLDNPTDPLSQAVARYAAAIPRFDTYMAAMGFKSPYKAVRYMMDHPSERMEYVKLVKSLYDSGQDDQLDRPQAIQERLRVAGSSEKDSLLRTTNLTRPLERLFGVAINRPPAARYFSGNNTVDQLENAIESLRAIGVREFEQTLDDADREAIESIAVESDEDLTPKERTAFDTFAASVPKERRQKVISAAERYLERITGEERLKPGEKEKEGIYALPGFEPLPPKLAVEEEPEPVAAPTAAQRFTGRGIGFGGDPDLYQRNLEEARREREAADAAAMSAQQPPARTVVQQRTTPGPKPSMSLPPEGSPPGTYDAQGRPIPDPRNRAIADKGDDTAAKRFKNMIGN